MVVTAGVDHERSLRDVAEFQPWPQHRLARAAVGSDEKRRQVLERVFFHDIMNTAGGISTMAGMLSTGDLAFEEVKDDDKRS